MRTEDVTDTLDLALAASGCDSATVSGAYGAVPHIG
jgi:hypothetical protein